MLIIFWLLISLPSSYAYNGCAESEQGIFEQVLHGDLDFSSDPWPAISESAKDLVRKMLVRDPRRRLTAHQVLCKYVFTSLFLVIILALFGLCKDMGVCWAILMSNFVALQKLAMKLMLVTHEEKVFYFKFNSHFKKSSLPSYVK